jgi:hypothetical protein
VTFAIVKLIVLEVESNLIVLPMTAPLIARGEIVGHIGLVHRTPGYYTPRHAALAMLRRWLPGG